MAGGSLFFDIFGRDKGVGKVFDDIHGKAEGLSGTFGKIGGGAAKLVAPLAGLFALDSLKNFSTESVAAFSELEDSSAAAGVVFGDSMSKIIEQSKTADATLGMTSQQVINAANTYGTYGKAAGLTGDELAGFSTELTQLSGDMASFKGTSTEQAIEAVGAALRGETEPIRAYGVMLDDASMREEAFAQGLITSTKEALTPQQKILAARALILKQTSDAQGDFARTSESTANVAKTLASAQENLSAKMGGLLAPAFTAVRLKALEGVRGVSGFLDKVIEAKETAADGGTNVAIMQSLFGVNSSLVKPLAEGLGSARAFFAGVREGGEVTSDGIAGAFEAGGIRINSFFTDLRGSGSAFFAAFKAGDGDITSSGMAGVFEQMGYFGRQLWDALSPLVPTILQVWQQFSPLSMLFQVLGPILPQIAQQLGGIATTAAATLVPFLQSLTPMIGSMLTAVLSLVPGLMPVIQALMNAFLQLVPAIMPLVGMALPLIMQLIPPLVGLLGSLIPIIIQIIQVAIVPLIQMLGEILPPVISALLPIVETVFGLIATVITSVLQIVTGIINTVMAIIRGDWGAAWDGILQILSGIGNLVIGVVTGLGQLIWQILSGAMQTIGAIWSAGWNFVGNVVGGIFGGILGGAQTMVGGLLGFFGGLPGQIAGFFAGAGQWLWDAGRNIVEGLGKGLQSMAGTIGNFFLNMLPDWIREPFKAALGIHSPSREFAGYGRNIGEGVLVGVGQMQDRIDARMSSLVTVPEAEIPGLYPGNSSRAGGTSSNLADKLDALLELLRTQRPVQVNPAPGMDESLVGRATAEQLLWKG